MKHPSCHPPGGRIGSKIRAFYPLLQSGAPATGAGGMATGLAGCSRWSA